MPYISCPSCGLPTYTAGSGWARDFCPACDAELPRRARSTAPMWEHERPADADAQLSRVLVLARRELGMDVAFLGEVRGDTEVIRAVAGPDDAVQVMPGVEYRVDDTICGALLAGRVDNVVPDTTADPETADLPVPKAVGTRAYIGVPITGEDARRYMLCCLAFEARPALGPRDVQVLQGLAESVRSTLHRDG